MKDLSVLCFFVTLFDELICLTHTLRENVFRGGGIEKQNQAVMGSVVIGSVQ